jgi:heme-degrading monooxygenase HmoA
MIIVVFRSRLREEALERYGPVAEEMERLGTAMPGLVSFKTYTANDGERVSIMEWESQAHLRAWREHPEHRKAQALGRSDFYEDYTILVSEELRRAEFQRS